MVARHRWSSGELGSPSADRLVICRARPLNSTFCCRDACSDVFDWSGRGYRAGGFGNLGRPLPRFGFGRRRNTGAGVGGRMEAVSASFFMSSMSRRALNSSSRALCPSWLDARSAVDELTLPSRCHHDCCDSPVATARLRAVPDAFQRTPRFGRGPTASLHQHGDGPTSAIAPGVNLGPRGNDFFHDFFRAVPSLQATILAEAGRIGAFRLLLRTRERSRSRTSCRTALARGSHHVRLRPFSAGERWTPSARAHQSGDAS